MRLNTRELFRRTMHFQPVDRTPLWKVEDVTAQAERRWCRDEGVAADTSGELQLGFDCPLVTLQLGDQSPIPGFVSKTVGSDDSYVYLQDVHGSTVKREKANVYSPTHYVYVGAPLRTIDDWRAMARRFDPLDPRRLPSAWSVDMVRHLNESDAPVTTAVTWGPARGIKNGYMFGFERFMEIVACEPSTLEEIFEYWAGYILRLLEGPLSELRIDAFVFREDGMGYRNSTLVSPALFRRVWCPRMRLVTDRLRARGVDVIGYYSSGNVEPLLPELLGIGVNLIAPVEAAAGMDAPALRSRYGRDLLMVGNIARQSIMDGKAAIEAEVRRKVPALMRDGGFIPALDDAVMPDMRFADVKYCCDLVKSTPV